MAGREGRAALVAASTVLAVGLVSAAAGSTQVPVVLGLAPTPTPAAPEVAAVDTALRAPVVVPSRPTARQNPATTARPVVLPRGRGNGVITRVRGTGPAPGSGPLRRYTVAVEGGLGLDPLVVATTIERVLSDPRSWGADGRGRFRRVETGPVDFRVAVVSPLTTDRWCRPLETLGRYSCAQGTLAVLNSTRWLTGAPSYVGRLDAYRTYLVNHEVGHVLGHGHAGCPGRGQPAPVMMQQTKGVGGCVAQPWPFG